MSKEELTRKVEELEHRFGEVGPCIVILDYILDEFMVGDLTVTREQAEAMHGKNVLRIVIEE